MKAIIHQTKLRSILFLVCIYFLLLSGCDRFSEKIKETDRLAKEMSSVMKQVRTDVVQSANASKRFFLDPDQFKQGLFQNRSYVFHNEVMYHNPEDDGNGKMLYSGYVPVGAKEKQKVKVMEHMIPVLKQLVESSPQAGYIIQSYLITHDSLFVFYPYANLIAYLPPKRNIRDRGGWKRHALAKHRQAQWTPPYVDTVGKGFMVTVTCPVFIQDHMEAFVGADITLKTIKDNFLQSKDRLLLIDKPTSQLFAMTAGASRLLQVENAEAFKYLKMVENKEVLKSVMPKNLILNKTDSTAMAELWRKIPTGSQFEITISGKSHQVYQTEIKETSWYLVLID